MQQITVEFLIPMDQSVESLFREQVNISFRVTSQSMQKGFGGAEAVQLVEGTLNVLGGLVSGIVGNFLYDQLKGKASKLWINSKKTDINHDAIEQTIKQYQNSSTPSDPDVY